MSTAPVKSPTARPMGGKAPGPDGRTMLAGMLGLGRQDVVASYVESWRQYGDVVRFKAGPVEIHLFVRPDHVRQILVQNADNYPKGASHDKLRVALGNGILTSEGDFWKRQRKLMQPTYTPRAVGKFADIMVDATAQMIKRWESRDRIGKPMVVNQEMMRLTMSVISRSMFGIDIGESFADAGHALVEILEFTAARSMSFIDPPLFIPTPGNRHYKHALKMIDNYIYGIIRERQKQPLGDDLLSLLMAARDEETGLAMDEKQLRDEVLITFFAGHETTAQTLTWTWYKLSKYPEVEAKLHEELDRVLGGRSPTVDDLPNLVYTRMVLDETLRLYSPVALMARDPLADDVIDGYRVPAGSLVTIAPFITHRHPEFWSNPEAYIPERFTADLVEKRPRYAYYPFGAGARICLGQHFALLEGMLVLADVAQRYRFEIAPGLHVEPEFVGTLRPSRDVLVKVVRRG